MISKIIFFTVIIAFAAAGMFGKLFFPLLMRLRLVSANGYDRSADTSGENIRPGGGFIIMTAAAMTAATVNVILSAMAYGQHDITHYSDDEKLFTAAAVFAVLGGSVGFFSDHLSVTGKKGGISDRDMLISEILLTAAFLWVHCILGGTVKIYVPFLGEYHHGVFYDMGAAYYPLTAAVMLAVMRSFEYSALTDGIMCASSGVSFLGAAMLVTFCGYSGIFPAAVSGSCLGFLTLNFPPAKTSCGRSGALFAGFCAAALIAVTGQTVLLPVMLIPVLTEGISFELIRKKPRPLSRSIISKGIKPHYVVMIWFAASVIAAASGTMPFLSYAAVIF